MTIDYAAQASMSEYDFLEFVAFAWKVEREGFTYAAENYGPEFEADTLQAVADDLSSLRALYRKHLPLVDAWVQQVGGEKACDLHNGHIDEARQRKEDARLWGIRCTDGYVITSDSQESRDASAARLAENAGKGWREPAALLARTVPGGEWTSEVPA